MIESKEFHQANNVLIIGMGGGFDVFSGLPFVSMYNEKKFVLANIFYDRIDYTFREAVSDYPHCKINDCNMNNAIIANYSIGRNGAKLTKSSIEKIVEKHSIDFIIAVDGGVDSLMFGDEEDSGTVLEDFNSLAALNAIETPKIMVNAGFGTETEENINHYRALENIAQHIKSGAFQGMFFLNRKQHPFNYYKYCCEKAWADGGRKSHIQTKIISAALGAFEKNLYPDVDPKLSHDTGVCFVNPLNAIYWMFNLHVVALENKFVNALSQANTFADSQVTYRMIKNQIKTPRTHEVLPL